MSYNDLSVIKAKLFLEAIADDVEAVPSVREALATADVLEAMRRSSKTGSWEPVRHTTPSSHATVGHLVAGHERV